MTHRLRFVYVMQLDDCIKVGMATSPIRRARSLSKDTGREHRLHRVYDCGGWARNVERPVLKALEPHRIQGEYFACSAEDAEVAIIAEGAVVCDTHQDNRQKQIRMDDDLRARFDKVSAVRRTQAIGAFQHSSGTSLLGSLRLGFDGSSGP